MTRPGFVYVTYIATMPQTVWQAFVDTDMMARYWVSPTSHPVRPVGSASPYRSSC